MRRASGKIFTRALLILGALLVTAAVLFATVSQINKEDAAERAGEIVEIMYSLMPEVRDTFPDDDRVNKNMPLLEIWGESYVGIIDAPAYDISLPIYGTWDTSKISDHPCVYMGGVYSGDLVIGGSADEGQLDFVRTVSVGDEVYITDAAGLRYTYIVAEAEITDDVSTEKLSSGERELVLFARNPYAFDYTVIRCDIKNK